MMLCMRVMAETVQIQVLHHYNDVIMSAIVSPITSMTIVCSTVYSGADQRKHQSSASLAFVWGIPVNFRHEGPVTWKMFPFDGVIMTFTKTVESCTKSVKWGRSWVMGAAATTTTTAVEVAKVSMEAMVKTAMAVEFSWPKATPNITAIHINPWYADLRNKFAFYTTDLRVSLDLPRCGWKASL